MDEKKILNTLLASYNININALELLREGGCVSYCVLGGNEKYFMKIVPSAFIDTAKQSLSILMYLEEKGFLQVHGKEFFIDRYINILKKKNYDANKTKMFREYGDTLWKRVENLPRGFCHGDMHRGNILRTSSDKYYLI